MAEPETGTKVQISDDPLDFVQLVLYVRRGVPACEQLLAHVSDRLDVLIQDVDIIEGDKPPWLRGIPTVVKMPERQVLTGSRAIECVLREIGGGISGISADACGAPTGSRGGAPLGPEDAPSAAGFRDLFTLQDHDAAPALPMAPPSNDGRYEDVSKTKTHDVSLEVKKKLRFFEKSKIFLHADAQIGIWTGSPALKQ
jgi:hypothetical protein